jgi:hypothetical protein
VNRETSCDGLPLILHALVGLTRYARRRGLHMPHTGIWVQTQYSTHHGIMRFILDSLLFSVINSVAKFTADSNVQAA